jgi:hypothetical protein
MSATQLDISRENENQYLDINLLDFWGIEYTNRSGKTRKNEKGDVSMKPAAIDTESLHSEVSKLFKTPLIDHKTSHHKIKERYLFLAKLKPTQFVLGSNSFQHYFGAKFSENLVVFENIEYGNAIYVMFGKWRKLRQLSRKELMANYQEGKDFIRIVHQDGWKEKLKAIIEKYNR